MLNAHTKGMLGKADLLGILNDRQWLRGAYLHAWTHMIGRPIGICSVSDLRTSLRQSNVYRQAVEYIGQHYQGCADFITLDADARQNGKTIAVQRWGDPFICVSTDVTANNWATDRVHKHNDTTLWHGLVIPLCPGVLSLALKMCHEGDLSPASDSQRYALALANSLNQRFNPAPPPPPPAPAPVQSPLEALGELAKPYSDDAETPVKSFDNSNSEVSEMSNAISAQAVNARRVVLVRIMDTDPALLVEHSHVFDSGAIVTESDDQTTIMQALTDYDINTEVARHNAIRATLTDETILRTTGQDVKLRPIKLKDLSITVVRV